MGVKKDGDYGTMHRILKILAWRYATAKEIAELLGITRQAVYYHLNRLVEWGFVIRDTKECIEAICVDEKWNICIYEDKEGQVILLENVCMRNKRGHYYVYAANYYIRKVFLSRPVHDNYGPPTQLVEIVRSRLRELGILDEVRGYDLFLMTCILQLMTAVLWNSRPRGESYWVRLKHLTVRGIYRNLPKFLYWYVRMKAALKAKEKYPKTDDIALPGYLSSTVSLKELRKKEYQRLVYEYSNKYTPTLRKIRWILARMYDYLMVERLGGDHCPYGIWVPHPSLFSPDKKPDFHLPRHRHVNAKHRYKPLNVKQSFTEHHSPDNHPP